MGRYFSKLRMRCRLFVWRWRCGCVEVVAITVVFGILSLRPLSFERLLQLTRVGRLFGERGRARRGRKRGHFTTIWFSIFCAICTTFCIDQEDLVLGTYCICCGNLAYSLKDGGGARHGGAVGGLIVLGMGCMCSILPIHKLDGRHHEIAVWPSSMSKYEGDADTVVSLVVAVVSKRDRRAAHLARILRCNAC